MENVNRHIHLAHHFRAKKLTKNVQIDCMKDFFNFHYDEGILYKINQLM